MKWCISHRPTPDARETGHSPNVWLLLAAILVLAASRATLRADDSAAIATSHFRKEVQPILTKYCSDCHADGANKGGVAFDEFKTDQERLDKHELWLAVLKNLRAGLMPPEKKPHPSKDEIKSLERWIKFDAFGIDPSDPDPGRVTVRRLNRVEYRNTIRDLMGIDFNTDTEFPPDDSGFGFDNIGDVLTLSPMLMEKYLAASRTIINRTVPLVPKVPAEVVINGRSFHGVDYRMPGVARDAIPESTLALSYYRASSVSNAFTAERAGRYQLVVDLTAAEHYVVTASDYNKCRVIFRLDGEELSRQEYVREPGKPIQYVFDRDWVAGPHELTFEVEPLTPGEKRTRALSMWINSVTVRGPMDEQYWVAPRNHERYFNRKETPKDPAARRAYAGELLGAFAKKAFRRPVDGETVDRLTSLAEAIYREPEKTFEEGVAQGMVAVLASPRFLFREEAAEADHAGKGFPLVDEYSLASRLSYFLWSSMPDEELLSLADSHLLRKNLGTQVKRMMADPRSVALMKNFTGQWLQARDVARVPIDARAVMARDRMADPETARVRLKYDELRARPEGSLSDFEKESLAKLRYQFEGGGIRPRLEMTGELREAMRLETEMYFTGIVREDRSVLELIESNYTYLNERLARLYGLTNLSVVGTAMRKVTLPPDSPRGGVLTQGTVLLVTSNPNRTSPVKRGLFVLENILGSPPAPPPPNIPALEETEKSLADHEPSLRKVLEMHREKPLCSSCHSRMDPPGFAFENFNAMGMWRETERGQAIEPAGKLITGEPFKDIRELKHILATRHQEEFYRTMTEKLLIYALGRGLESYDVETVDRIVQRLADDDGHFSALLGGIIESAPFQKRRTSSLVADNRTAHP
jgi:hypothetical protein